jgi:ABC-type sugar transport system ATPase subunit
MRKTQADIQQEINNKRKSYNMQKIYCNHYKNNKMYISGGIQYMSPDDWAKVGIISEVLPENLYASCIKEFNWAPRS